MILPARATIGFVVFTVALSACGGSASRDAADSDDEASTGSSSSGARSGTGGGSGGMDSLAAGGLSFTFPPSPLVEGCELTVDSTEWRRSIAQESCFATEVFFTEGRPAVQHFSFPTFPESALGGAGGVGPDALEFCPGASALEWSCQVSEGTRCSFPQCELPTTASPVDGECCYIVASVAGV